MRLREILLDEEVDDVIDTFLEVQCCLELVSQRIDKVLQSESGGTAERRLLDLLTEIRQRMLPDFAGSCRILSKAA